MRLFHDRKYVANDYNMFIEKTNELVNFYHYCKVYLYFFIYFFIHNYFNVLTNFTF